jgi:putative Mn2+ efflux pump MntP
MEAQLNNVWYILAIAVALGADAFSVSLGIGANKPYRGQAFRLGFHFGLFQFFMPLIGCAIGQATVSWIHQYDHWLAAGVIGCIGLRMLWGSLQKEEKKEERDLSRGWFLVSLCVATSIDALAVGLVFGVVKMSPWWPSVVIGCVASTMSLVGLFLGRYLRAVFGKVIEVAGGLLLLFVAVKLFAI